MDAEAFDTASMECRQSEDEATCQTAPALFTGGLLTEDRYDDWVATRQESLHWLYLNLLSKLGTMVEAQEDIEQAIDIFHRVVAADPTPEHAHRGFDVPIHTRGTSPESTGAIPPMREILDRQLALDHDPDSRRLYDDILCGRLQIDFADR